MSLFIAQNVQHVLGQRKESLLVVPRAGPGQGSADVSEIQNLSTHGAKALRCAQDAVVSLRNSELQCKRQKKQTARRPQRMQTICGSFRVLGCVRMLS